MKKFLTVLGILSLVLLQVYLCTYTNLSKALLLVTPIVISVLSALAVGGFSKSNATDNDGQTGTKVTIGVFVVMTVIVYLFTYLALRER